MPQTKTINRAKMTAKDRVHIARLMRECGARAYAQGQALDALSPLVSAWRTEAWRTGWRSAQRKARQVNKARLAKIGTFGL